MKLFTVPPSHICIAWRDGADKLSQATARASREITADQLKLLLLRGERTLIGIADDSDIPRAWAAVQIQTLPNIRVLYVYAMVGPGFAGAESFELLRQYAKQNGCETIRGSSIDSIGRLWQRRFGAQKLYSVYEMEVN